MHHPSLAILTASVALALSAFAQNSTSSTTTLDEVVVTERSDSLIGIAGTAAEGTVGNFELSQRPILRPGEILEAVPGVIITQHAGGGKANQYFLRGFNLDHGTDFATFVDGVPINLPSHAHGQGYTDINFLIPEVVGRVDYVKGPYYAKFGDFSSAGAAEISTLNTLRFGIASATVGNYGYVRGVVAQSVKLGAGDLIFAIEGAHSDGSWDRPDDYKRGIGFLKYSQGDAENGFSLTLNGYHGDWNGTQQVPKRAVDDGRIGRFGSFDETDGGDSTRVLLVGEWHHRTENTLTKFNLYTSYYDLDLFSNFTYALSFPDRGDQFEQKDRRQVSGLRLSHEIDARIFGQETKNTFGLDVRNDVIRNGLFNTDERNRFNTVRSDRIDETSLSPYFENKTQWAEKFRTVAGVRADFFFFDVESDRGANSGNTQDELLSPKLQLIFGPWAKTEVYLSGGFGFHSNDARGTTASLDPASRGPADAVPGLVRSRGAEIGVRTTVIKGLQSTASLWYLESESELLFVGDAGNTEPGRASQRYGIELANYWTPTDWLTIDADFALSKARFQDDDPAGNRIPEAIQSVLAAGISVHDWHGWSAGVRLRYFGPRDLIEDGSVKSTSSTLVYANVGYKFNETWSVSVDAFNVLNSKENDQEYFYPSRLRGEPEGPDDGGYNDRHFHPAEAFSARFTITAHF